MFFTFASPRKEGKVPLLLESLPPPNNFSGPNVWPNQYRQSITAYGILNSIYTAKRCLWQTFLRKEQQKNVRNSLPSESQGWALSAPLGHPGQRCLGAFGVAPWREPSTLESAWGGDAPRRGGDTPGTQSRGVGSRWGHVLVPLCTHWQVKFQNLRKVLPVAQAGFCWKHGGKWSTVSVVLPTGSAWGMDGKRSPSSGQVMLKQPWIHIL